MMFNQDVQSMTDDEIADEITAIGKIKGGLLFGIDDLVEGTANLDFLKDCDLSMTANKAFFERDEQGFLPEMMDTLYKQRKTEKVKQLDADQDVETIKSILHERGVDV